MISKKWCILERKEAITLALQILGDEGDVKISLLILN